MIDLNTKRTIMATCPRGLAPYLTQEIQALGYNKTRELPLGVELEGTLTDCIRLNLHLRTAHRVHLLIERFPAHKADHLYKNASNIPWEKLIKPEGYVSIHSWSNNETVKDSRFPSLRLKDALVDRMRQKTGKRPNSGPEKNRTVIYLHWYKNTCQVWLDTSGEPLNRRGYRKAPHRAPMQETLAAAAILASRYTPGGHFINPMCGSGTLALEAALIASNRAPGLTRSNFGFMHVLGFDRAAYTSQRTRAKAVIINDLQGEFILSDRDPNAIKAARINAEHAELDQYLRFETCDFSETTLPSLDTAPEKNGVVMLNPEYGVRLGDESELETVYQDIGNYFKQTCKGYTGYIFTGNPALGKRVGLRTSRKIPFFNSKIECRLLEYELYSGTKKAKGDKKKAD